MFFYSSSSRWQTMCEQRNHFFRTKRTLKTISINNNNNNSSSFIIYIKVKQFLPLYLFLCTYNIHDDDIHCYKLMSWREMRTNHLFMENSYFLLSSFFLFASIFFFLTSCHKYFFSKDNNNKMVVLRTLRMSLLKFTISVRNVEKILRSYKIGFYDNLIYVRIYRMESK